MRSMLECQVGAATRMATYMLKVELTFCATRENQERQGTQDNRKNQNCSSCHFGDLADLTPSEGFGRTLYSFCSPQILSP